MDALFLSRFVQSSSNEFFCEKYSPSIELRTPAYEASIYPPVQQTHRRELQIEIVFCR